MMTPRLTLSLTPGFLVCSSAFPEPAKTGSWGDQGDGTYKNPVLNAHYPDVDVEQVGGSWI